MNQETYTASKDRHNNANTNTMNQDSLEFLGYSYHIEKAGKILSIINHQLNPKNKDF